MTVLRARYGRIRGMTASVLSRCRITKPAVPIEDIVAETGIELRQGDLGDVSGLLARRGTLTIIGVNSGQPVLRQRFTMAHELGHFMLHGGLVDHSDTNFRVHYRDRTSSEATDAEEVEANFFAACLLMPKMFLDERGAAEALDDDDAVGDLADLFQVSRLAMSLRLVSEYGRYRPF